MKGGPKRLAFASVASKLWGGEGGQVDCVRACPPFWRLVFTKSAQVLGLGLVGRMDGWGGQPLVVVSDQSSNGREEGGGRGARQTITGADADANAGAACGPCDGLTMFELGGAVENVVERM